MNKLIIFISIFINLQPFSLFASTIDRPTESYVRILDALRNITPDDITKIIMVFDYKYPPGDYFRYQDPIATSPHDLAFYQSIFPYVKNTLILTDKDKLNYKSARDKIAKHLNDTNAKIILLMFSGHGMSEDGAIALGQYKEECMKLQREDKNILESEKITNPNRISKVSSKFYENWLMNRCEDIFLTADQLFGSNLFNKNQKVIFFNSTCHSGTYKQYLDNATNPTSLLALAYAAEQGQYTFTKNSNIEENNIIQTGGEMILKLKQRLLPQQGCNLDGASNVPRDLILSFYEWTYKMGETKFHADPYDPSYEIPSRMDVSYSRNIDIQTISLPVQVYTEDQCSQYQPIETRHWENIKDKAEQYSKQISNISKEDINSIFEIQTQISAGKY